MHTKLHKRRDHPTVMIDLDHFKRMQQSIWTFRWNDSFMRSCKNSEIFDQVIRYGVQVGCQEFTMIVLEIS